MNSTTRVEGEKLDVLRVISDKEFKEIIEAHALWVKSNKREGKRCDLHKHNLRKLDFSGLNLTEASFTGADLTEAKFVGAQLCGAHLADAVLRGANLCGANLVKAVLSGSDGQDSMFVQATLDNADLRRGIFARANFEQALIRDANLERASLENANLREADLTDSRLAAANLRQADLSSADLRRTRSLASDQLGGANVYGAQLPEGISRFEGLDQVIELSKMIKTLYASIILGSVYSWLTISATTDVQLVTNSTSSPLPIIQTPIQIASFYSVAPFVLSAIFIYFQLYLARFWTLLASLPAIFPDGNPLDRKAHPWLLNSLLSAYVPRLSGYRPSLSGLEVLIAKMLAWWTVPFTVALFWIFSLQKHSFFLTGSLILCVSLTSSAAVGFLHMAKLTLRGQEKVPLAFKTNWMSYAFYKALALKAWPSVMIAATICGITFIISDGAFNGVKLKDGKGCPREEHYVAKQRDDIPKSSTAYFARILVPRLLPCIGARASADLIEQDISVKPANWFLQKDEELARIVQGAQMKNADLRRASAQRAFLVKADLRDTHLEDADLRGALLREANLNGAQLKGANLSGAQLQKADLRGLKFQGVNLYLAQLDEANLIGAQLQGAELNNVQLEGANMTEAQLQQATFLRAKLKGANLSKAQLQNADLRDSELQGVILTKAQLQMAQLQGADLEGAIGLTQIQINQACVDSVTRLPSGLSHPEPCVTPQSP